MESEMKIYVASSFSLIPKIEEVVEALEAEGHQIIVKWWSRIYQTEEGHLQETSDLKKIYADLEPAEFYARPETFKSYMADVEGIKEADALVLVAPDEAGRVALVGARVELGIAIGLQIPCFSIGSIVNSAMYWGIFRASDIPQLIKDLRDLA